MTLQDFINTYTGQYLLTPGQPESLRGQCVQLVQNYALEVQGVTLPVYPDAKDYWTTIAGYTQVNSNPEAGDIAVYNGHDIYPEGHIAVYAGNGEVFEQNADPNGSPAHLFARANMYLLGYLRKQGGEGMLNDNGTKLIWQAAFRGNLTPSQADLDYWRNQPWDVCLDTQLATSAAQQVDGWIEAGKSAATPTVLAPGIYEVKQ